MDVIKLKTATFSLDTKGFIRVVYNATTEVEDDDAELHIQAVLKLSGNKDFIVLIDVRNALGSISTEAMRRIAKDERVVALRKAQAIIVKSLAHRLLANFYIKFYKPANPVKIFNDEDEAVRWLKKFSPAKVAI